MKTNSNLNQVVKLHLGCGMKYIESYKHVDIIEAPHIDYNNSVDDLSDFEDNSIDLIYASHVLEHFGRYEVEDVLKGWYRILKDNGLIRIAVPDFAAVVRIYAQEGLKDGFSGIVGLVCGGQKNNYDYHKIIFDEPFLTSLLMKVGFRNITKWDWRNTEHSHIDDYSQSYIPHMDKDNGSLMSLNIQANK
jgi:predicted SAM-dependent methyltransferase